MKNMLRPSSFLFLLVAIVLATGSAFADPKFILLGKDQRFRQTGAGTVIADASGPFRFSVGVDYPGLTLTTPNGDAYAIPVSHYNDQSHQLVRSFTTKAALDAAFPNGTYTLSGPGIPTIKIVMASDAYPTTPQLTGGNWNAGGALILAPNVATTINFNASAFTTYTSPGVTAQVYAEMNASGHVEAQTFSRAVPGLDVTVTAQPLPSMAIPASVIQANNWSGNGELNYEVFSFVDTTTIPGTIIAAGYGSLMRYNVSALSSGTGGNPPSFTAQPSNVTVSPGGKATFNIAVSTGTAAGQGAWFDWRFNGEGIETDGSDPHYTMASNGSLTINNVTADDAGTYTVMASNTGGFVISNAATLTVPVAPVISLQPAAQNAVAGGSVTFTVASSGTGNTYQWRKDGAAISGATSSSLTLTNVSAANAGSYTVVVTNSVGTVTSSAATLTLVPANAFGRLINLSILTSLAPGGDSFTLGYVVGGATAAIPKPLVIRAVGPSLPALGVNGPIDDPKLDLFAGSASNGGNDNWGGGADLTSAMVAVGAFALSSPTSHDAAVAANITSRDNSVKVSAAGTGSGAVIAEIYDATPASSFSGTTPRLLNVSVLKNIGQGLTAGFVIGGSTAKTVLVRAIGPTLGTAPFNVSGVLADPQLALFSGANKIGENNDWSGTPALTAAFTQVGAFALPATSKDAALLTTLNPGNYTVQVSGVGNTTGTALVEVYEVP